MPSLSFVALLTQLRRTETDSYALWDAGTGKDKWAVAFENRTFWYTRGSGRAVRHAHLSDPNLVFFTSQGVRIYWRNDGRRDD